MTIEMPHNWPSLNGEKKNPKNIRFKHVTE